MGLSVLDVYRKTHVPMAYIQAIEASDVYNMPSGECYAVGFVRTYCEFLGLDPNRYADSLRETYRNNGRGNPAPAVKRAPSLPSIFQSDAFTWVAVMAAIVLAWMAYSVVVGPAKERAEDQVQAGTLELAPPQDFEFLDE